MALQVWLPLNKNEKIENRGLSDITISGNPTYVSSGKLGGCFQFNSKMISIPTNSYMEMKSGNSFSVAFWVKGTSTGWLLACNAWEFRFREDYIQVHPGPSGATPAKYTTTTTSTQWRHCAFTWNNDTLILYVDGVLRATSTFSSNFNIDSTLWLCFDGTRYLNDFRIYNHCLSPKEVKEISKGLVLHYKMDDPCINKNVSIDPAFNNFNGGTYTYDNSTNTYTITSSVTSSTWGSGVCLKDPQITVPWGSSYRCSFEVFVPTAHDIQIDYNNYLSDGNYTGNDNDSGRMTSGFSIPANTWTKVVIGATNANSANTSKASLIVYDAIGLKTDKDSSSVTWYIRNVKSEITNDPSSYSKNSWSNNIVYDCSGYNNHGTVNGNITASSDTTRYKESYYFNGSSYITGPGLYNIFNSLNYSTSWWFKSDNTIQWGTQIRVAGTEATNQQLHMGIYSSSQYGFSYYSNDKYAPLSNPTGIWHHVAASCNGNIVKLYIDGTLAGTFDQGASLNVQSNAVLMIGKDYRRNSYAYTGKISDFRIYATALSEEDVKELYNTSAMICDNGTVMAYSLEE